MITFFISILALLAGYFFYSKFVERAFGADANRQTPAMTMADGVDYVPLKWHKIFLIQFLNIAGLGPIFGAMAGAMWGPVAFLWIVFGSIFAGAVHDYLSGMLSIKHKGLSITEIVGIYLGNGTKQFMRAFTVILMIIVGAVFIMGPAKILNDITLGFGNLDNPASSHHVLKSAANFIESIGGVTFWVWVVFIYYILATMLPVDKLIGRIYPFFGFTLLFMAAGIFIMMIFKQLPIPELTWANMHNMNSQPEKFPILPMLFITVACGAISGFHATQSPLMARCITNEKLGRRVFYGAMITEGIVALIWAAVGMSFYGGVKELNEVMIANKGNAAVLVNEITRTLLGPLGGLLALLGVVAAPITSGDTAFRGARLIVADFLHYKQGPIKNRLLICIPLFIMGFLLTKTDFGIIWRYFAWFNQTLGAIVLWALTMYLIKEGKLYWITMIPAVFMTMVVVTYIFYAPEGLHLPMKYAYSLGIATALSMFTLFLFFVRKYRIASDTITI
jgi:carbon starvation protein CstA